MEEKTLTTTEINAALESIDICKQTALSIAFTVVEKIRQRNNNNADMKKADWITELKELEEKMYFYDQLGFALGSVIQNCSGSHLVPVLDTSDICKQADGLTEDKTIEDVAKKSEAMREAAGLRKIGNKHDNVTKLS